MSDPLVIVCSLEWDRRWSRLVEEHLQAVGLGGERLAHVMPDAGGLVSGAAARGMETARLAVLIITPTFLSSQLMMATVLRKLIMRASVVMRHGQKTDVEFLPVICRECQWAQLPETVSMLVTPDQRVPLEKRQPRDRCKALAAAARRAYAHLQAIGALPEDLAWKPPAKGMVELGPLQEDLHLAEHQPREELVHELQVAWMDSKTRILNLVGPPGVGKSTLLAHGVRTLARDNYRGAERVFAWSFADQAGTGGSVDALPFFHRAEEFFGLAQDPALPYWQIGARLARHLQSARALVILDEAQLLQTADDQGSFSLRDDAVLMFLRKLAKRSSGLCVVASEHPLTELAPWEGKSLKMVRVDGFTPVEGVELLQRLQTPGDATQHKSVAECAGGHPLMLRLLGAYLSGSFQRETGRLADFSMLFGVLPQERTREILKTYLHWLENRPERELLNLLSVATRPLTVEELQQLQAGEPIAGFTCQLAASPGACAAAIEKLRRAGAVHVRGHDVVHVHPLLGSMVRSELVGKADPSSAKILQRMLAIAQSAQTARPQAVEEAVQVLQTMQQACAAGSLGAALHDCYLARLWGTEDTERMSPRRQLVARCRALSGLLTPEGLPLAELDAADRVLVARHWRRGLRAVGRFAEATAATEAQRQQAHAAGDRALEAEALAESAELMLLQGQIKGAARHVNQLLLLTEQSPRLPLFRDAVQLSARILHLKGKLTEALARYELVRKTSPVRPVLLGSESWHCEALLDSGNFPLTERIAWRAWERLADQNGVAAAGFLLVLTRLYLALLKHSGDRRYCDESQKHLQKAVQLSVTSGLMELILAAQLTEAAHHHAVGLEGGAGELLADVTVLAVRSNLRLLAIDCQLEWVRLRLTQGRPAEANDRLSAIAEQVQATQYGRAARELAGIAQRLSLPGKSRVTPS